jgi:hypothetical protein
MQPTLCIRRAPARSIIKDADALIRTSAAIHCRLGRISENRPADSKDIYRAFQTAATDRIKQARLTRRRRYFQPHWLGLIPMNNPLYCVHDSALGAGDDTRREKQPPY